MPTTISLPTAVTTNSITGSNLFADDGVNTTGLWVNTHADVILSSFSGLSIPAGATINGIEVVVDGQGNVAPGSPRMVVYNGGWSTTQNFSGSFGKSQAEYDPGWGSSSNLWGLSWTVAQALAIQIGIVSLTITPGRQMYWDWVKVRITYTAAAGYGNAVNGVAAANIGKVNGVATANIEKVNGV